MNYAVSNIVAMQNQMSNALQDVTTLLAIYVIKTTNQYKSPPSPRNKKQTIITSVMTEVRVNKDGALVTSIKGRTCLIPGKQVV
ncbi:hypothetical protein DPMN_113408 [Dreissena polymorpha]|uniref:Uncharacterized protein n=1 Tax=Dreissena polymorpha TaxID=45954 RepID=A0A9D4QQY9_DREPO|nr:hypothetical protein DPMN_113408 [Dreissena polymorpha]